ncbi:hypothetical protein NIES2100_18950 [Calothrix sp. NIES-2100]|uniref:hypothetical protein n=1 Tax=Calothrix sp. NIES-2100 TaxID=1954172 RepID=UPI000B5E0AC0|nr:hypothetical protein NIES2100_18950 [Calothrix sp. NIES-2100]
MKIVEETRTRLQVKHQPIRIWFSGGIILIFGLSFLIYCIFFESASASLTCKRPQSDLVNCELKRFNLLGGMNKLKIFEPQAAYIQTHTSSKGERSYEIIIVTPVDKYAFLSHLSYQKNQELAGEINKFLNSHATYYSVYETQHSYVFFVSLFMLILTAIGAFLATTPVSKCTFYKSLNKVFIERKGLRSQQIIEYPLESILRFDIQEKQFKYSKLYRAVIVLRFYQQIPINPEYTNEKNVQYIVSRIRHFLNIGNS